MTREKNLEKALTEEKYKCRLVKSKKSWVIKGMLFSTLLVGGMSIQTSVYADEWFANTPESIQIEDGTTSYTLKNGDTLWAISQVTNIKVETLAEINNIDLNSGEQYNLEIGRIIYFDGNHITVKDSNGNVVADKVLNDSDKIDTSKTFNNQQSDVQKNPVQIDAEGNVKTQANLNSNPSSTGNSSSKNSNGSNNSKPDNNQQSSDKNGNNKPTTPDNKPTDPEKPVNPEKPEVKEYSVSVIHKDDDGNILEKEAEVKVKKGESYTAKAKEFDGYTLNGQPTQTVKGDSNKVITFFYKKNENPNPTEKFDITIKYVDETGAEITESDNLKIENGQEYTATAKKIEGYSLTSEATQTITATKNETITFKYTKNTSPVEKFKITLKFEDEEGKEILSSEIHEIEKGQIFTAQGKDITGYTLIGDNTQSITVTGVETITFKYTKNVDPIIKHPVTVEYRDEEGNLLSSESSIEIESGKSFTATAKVISGYTLVGENIKTIIVNKTETIVFTYKKDETPILVDKSELENLVNTVKDTDKGDYTEASYTTFTTALGVADNVLSDAEATQAEVDTAKINLQNAYDNLEEKAPEVTKYKVTVMHRDTNGVVLETEAQVEVEDGKQFTANAGTFTGYTLQGADSQTITVSADTTITFVYEKNEVIPPELNITEVEQAIASQALALINQHRNNNGLISLNNQTALQQGADVRSNEIFELYEHTRPNGEDGADAPYDYGYDQVVFCENIGMYNNPSSLEWLAQNGASIVVNAWINSSGHNANLLLDGLNEGSVGIHLQENGSGKYTMGSVFLGAKNYNKPTTKSSRSVEIQDTQKKLKFNIKENTETPEELPKATSETEDATSEAEVTTETTGEVTQERTEVVELTEKTSQVAERVVEEIADTGAKEEAEEQEKIPSVNKNLLLEAYNLALTLEESNYSVHSWSVLMIKLADAKFVYDNLDANQSDIDNAVLALQQAINNLNY